MNYQWHITDECDQRCSHCYVWNTKCQRISMSFEDIKLVLAKIKNFDAEPRFAITGGDPLLHDKFWKLLELLHDEHIPFRIFGNPFHINDSVCKKLIELGCEGYQLSLDGMEKIHDSIRMKGSFRATIKAIKLLKNSGLPVMVMTTVSSFNIKDVQEIIGVCAELDVDRYAFARYCPVGDNSTNGISPMEYKELLNRVDEQLSKMTWNGFTKKDHLWLLHEAEKIGAEELECNFIAGCSCGISHLTICPNGDVMACRRVANSVVGNILTDELGEIWFDRMNAYRQYNKFEKCSKCFLHKACRGCPAVAKGTYGSYYSPDPQCWKEV